MDTAQRVLFFHLLSPRIKSIFDNLTWFPQFHLMLFPVFGA